jgi:hypothetical protein
MDLIAPRVICVGTHHKTGTLWMRQVFRALAQAIGVPHHGAYGDRAERHIKDGERVMLFQWSSAFDDTILNRPDARILHMIRDPRDVLLSGMKYHQVAPEGGEAFLHHPREGLGGQTYQQHIAALPSEADKLRFEMDNKHAETLQQMLDWDYTRANTLEVRYEDLMRDHDCKCFRDALRNLGLPEMEVAKGVRLFWEKSLFGGQADAKNRSDRTNLHVASGQIAQWRTKLPPAVAEIYADRHGDALVQLGYETHPNQWLETLARAA